MKKVYLTIQIKEDLEYLKLPRTGQLSGSPKFKNSITEVYWKKQLATENTTHIYTDGAANIIQNIYEHLTDLFFYEDIYSYSADELFIDLTNYLPIYNQTAHKLATKVKNLIYKKFNVKIKCGLGPNLFLAKTACDLLTRKRKSDICILTEKDYITIFSKYEPLTDFWQISSSMQLKLRQLRIRNMEDIRNYDYSILYHEFGYNAEHLVNHSLGLEPTTFLSLKKVRQPKKLVVSETFQERKNKSMTLIQLINLIDFNTLKLIENSCQTSEISLSINYAFHIRSATVLNQKLPSNTNSYQTITNCCLELYNRGVNQFIPIEKITLCFDNLIKNSIPKEQNSTISVTQQSRQSELVAIPKMLNLPI